MPSKLLPAFGWILVTWLGGTLLAAADVPALEPMQIANLNLRIVTTDELQQTAQLQDRILLVTRGPGGRSHLWVSDLTAGGTRHLIGFPEDCTELCYKDVAILGFNDRQAFLQGIDAATEVPQLLVTDGTSSGTRQLTQRTTTELLSGTWSESLQAFLFATSEPDSGRELWISDGTPEGTRLVRDMVPGPGSSSPELGDVAETSSALFFVAQNDSGIELWRTDGTSEGTVQVDDIFPGAGFAFPRFLTAVGERIVFQAEDGVHGPELWSTDGTPEATRMLLDLSPGSAASLTGPPLATPDRAFYLLSDGIQTTLRHLVVTDGTPSGTQVVSTFERVEDLPLPEPELLGVVSSTAVLQAAKELWFSNGTEEGTRPLGCDTEPCPSSPVDAQPHGAMLIFRATDSEHGEEPWATDGTDAGTRLLADLCPGPCSSNPRPVASPDEMLVRADDGEHGFELWNLSDPTSLRLTDFFDLQPFVTDRLGGLAVGFLGGEVQFLAEDFTRQTAVWTTDGSAEGTRPIETVGGIREAGSRPEGFTRLGRNVLFGAHTETEGLGLWSWSLRDESLERVASLDSDPPEELRRILATASVGRRVVLAEELPVFRDFSGRIWSTDGTTAGTRELADGFAFGRTFSRQPTLPVLGSSVFFFNYNPAELWITNGTPAGTRLLGAVAVDDSVTAVTFGGRLWFSAFLEAGQIELWTSDGTRNGTRPFADLLGTDSSRPEAFTPFRGELYFLASGRLFKTDGVNRPVQVLPTFEEPIGNLSVVGNRLLLYVGSRFSFRLWATDGTTHGTQPIAPDLIEIAPDDRHPQQAELDGVLYLVDGRRRVWRTDGTAGGTFPLDLFPSSIQETLGIRGIHSVERRFVFPTRDETGELMVWISTGSPEGTRPLEPIRAVGSDFLLVGNQLFFQGDDGLTGAEPWQMELPRLGPLPPVPSGVPAAPDRLRAEGIPFGRVRLSWRDRSANETFFVLQARSSRLGAQFETVAVVPADTTTYLVPNLELGLPYHFRIRAEGADGASPWSAEVVATPFGILGDCDPVAPSRPVLCLRDDRFDVRVHWRNEATQSAGGGRPIPFGASNDSGAFWFFDPDNVELVVKVLDARIVNGFQWVFYGALSNVEYWVTVADLETRTNVTYYNPPGEICGQGDVRAFPRPEMPAAVTKTPDPPQPQAIVYGVETRPTGTAGLPCAPGTESLCLSQNRYRIEVDWRDPRSGDEGRGMAIPGTADSGYFWFFDSANVELVVKVLDGRTINGHVWVFFGALTDLEYTVTVTDTETGLAKTYRNEPGNICGQADVRAF